MVDTNGLSGERGTPDGGSVDADSAIRDTSVGDAGAADTGLLAFVDPFARPDGPIGNGWIEKSPGTFAIVNQRVSVRSASAYRDAIVYRPPGEDIGDVEVSQVVDVTTISGTYAQIHARVRSQTVAQKGMLDSYLLYVFADSNKVMLSRTRGVDGPLGLATIPLS